MGNFRSSIGRVVASRFDSASAKFWITTGQNGICGAITRVAADSHFAIIALRQRAGGRGSPSVELRRRRGEKRPISGQSWSEWLSQAVSEIVERPPIGPYRVLRPLESGRLAARWLAVHDRDQTSHVAHEFFCRDRAEQRRLISAFEQISSLDHPNIQPVQQFALADSHVAWLMTPYTGNQDGLVTLESLLQDKGGRMSADEADRALGQILRAVEFAHGVGHIHGPIYADQVLVDRRGRISIEMYGLQRRLGGLATGNSEVVRDEVRSVVELGYRLLTGLSAEEPRIPAGRLVERLNPHWDAWLDAGMDPLRGGYASAGEASAGLPSARRDAEPRVPVMSVRRVLGRVRAALRQGS